jgi:hypothetical protein
MNTLLRRIREPWRKSRERRDATAIENERVTHEAAERERHRETELPPGRTNTDWTYVPPG